MDGPDCRFNLESFNHHCLYITFLFQACTPELSNPRDGSVSTPDGSEFEDEAVYICNTGYELSESNGGSKRRSCLSSGSWSGNAPTCVRIGRSSLRETSKSFCKKLATLKQSPFLSTKDRHYLILQK